MWKVIQEMQAAGVKPNQVTCRGLSAPFKFDAFFAQRVFENAYRPRLDSAEEPQRLLAGVRHQPHVAGSVSCRSRLGFASLGSRPPLGSSGPRMQLINDMEEQLDEVLLSSVVPGLQRSSPGRASTPCRI